jgi:putative flippase GtrA
MIKKLTQHQIVRYLIGGSTSAVVNLLVLYFFNSVLGIYYLTASILAFCIAFFVSWAFHKFWTFREHSMDNAHTQGALYLLSSLFGLSLNTLILFVSVDIVHLPVLFGQIIAGGLVACCTFFISKHFIFKKKPLHTNEEILEEML